MKLLKQTNIKRSDAMIMNALVTFITWLDYINLGFGQSLLIVLRKIN